MISFYTWKTVLVTGSTGFKWAWLSLWLHSLWAKVIWYGLKPHTNPNIFDILELDKSITQYYGDISDFDNLNKVCNEEKPEIVFHLAAQALVRESYKNPLWTMQTNITGTVNVLELIRIHDYILWWVMITTDKVYQNKEHMYPYREIDRLWGHDPYSSSKAMCEIAIESYIKSYRKDYSKKIATMRAGNVIGGWDRSNDRLIPDIMRAIYHGQELTIRNPYAVRPRQYVLEAIHAYLMVWEQMFSNNIYCTSYNIWPGFSDNMQVIDIVNNAIKLLWDGVFNINHEANQWMHEAWLLMLDTTKIQQHLWRKPRYEIKETIEKTLHRYKSYYNGDNMKQICLDEISYYTQ